MTDYNEIKMPEDLLAWVIDRVVSEFDHPEWEAMTKSLLDKCFLSLEKETMELQIIIEGWDFKLGKSVNIFTFLAQEAKFCHERAQSDKLEDMKKGCKIILEYIEILQKEPK